MNTLGHAARQSVFLFCLVMVAGCVNPSSQEQRVVEESDGIERELTDITHKWVEAWRNRDSETMDKLLSDDFTNVSPDGKTQTRDAYLSHLKTYVGEMTRIDDIKVRMTSLPVVTHRWVFQRKVGSEVLVLEMFSVFGFRRSSTAEFERCGPWRMTSAKHTLVRQMLTKDGVAAN